ncbi:SDR family oxidoreductase [Oxyplasma meridianum]|uniref:SDR family oxidoreductase n=1 Tax=Oxyplasma meridianum TaxID=3073602 RepID=A0AAX4NF25_9ARCH
MTEKKLEGKTALITGGSRGIGKAISKLFSQEGAKVAVNYNSSELDAKKLKDEIPDLEIFKADMSSREQVISMFSDVRKKFGQIDILVNNAGIMDVMPFEQYDDARVRRMFDINVYGPIYASLEALELLKKSREPVIINLASNAGVGTSASGTTYYAMTKAAVVMLTKRMAFDFRDAKIRVNAIAPGWIKTDMTLSGKSEREIRDAEEFFKSRTSLSMTGEAIHIARTALFLASRDSEYMNGQILVVDGGRLDNLTHSL